MTRKHYINLADNLAYQLINIEREMTETDEHLNPKWNTIWDTINLSIIPTLQLDNDRFSAATFCARVHATLSELRESRAQLDAHYEAYLAKKAN